MDEAQFLDAFEAGTLQPFHQRDHIRLAWLYLRREGWENGYAAIQAGIQGFAAHRGATGLYHETITRFWAHMVYAALRAAPEIDDFATFEQANPSLFDKTYIYAFYNRPLLNSQAAREAWIESDLRGLPKI
jgi:hypothetical protein